MAGGKSKTSKHKTEIGDWRVSATVCFLPTKKIPELQLKAVLVLNLFAGFYLAAVAAGL